MKLIDFWKHLPGLWNFERKITNQGVNQVTQLGMLRVEKTTDDFYQAYEDGKYNGSSQQTFFRNYNFAWESNSWHIYGENPRDGYVLLHQINDVALKHTHFCGNDSYEFRLLDFSQSSWQSSTVITGPYKNLTLATVYHHSPDIPHTTLIRD